MKAIVQAVYDKAASISLIPETDDDQERLILMDKEQLCAMISSRGGIIIEATVLVVKKK